MFNLIVVKDKLEDIIEEKKAVLFKTVGFEPLKKRNLKWKFEPMKSTPT